MHWLVLCVAQSVLKVLSLIDWRPLAPFSLSFPFCLILFHFSIYWLDTLPYSLFVIFISHPSFFAPLSSPPLLSSPLSSCQTPNSRARGGEMLGSPWQRQVPFFAHSSQSWLELWVGPSFSELMRTGCALLPRTTASLRKQQPMGTQKPTTCLSNNTQQ